MNCLVNQDRSSASCTIFYFRVSPYFRKISLMNIVEQIVLRYISQYTGAILYGAIELHCMLIISIVSILLNYEKILLIKIHFTFCYSYCNFTNRLVIKDLSKSPFTVLQNSILISCSSVNDSTFAT